MHGELSRAGDNSCPGQSRRKWVVIPIGLPVRTSRLLDGRENTVIWNTRKGSLAAMLVLSVALGGCASGPHDRGDVNALPAGERVRPDGGRAPDDGVFSWEAGGGWDNEGSHDGRLVKQPR